MSRCPRCNCEATGQNRLVTDTCGHSKCRSCLLADVTDCSECKVASGISTVDVLLQPESEKQLTDTISGNHITATTQGYYCNVCNKSFRSRTQQYYHRSCGNETLKKFGCTQCNRRFASRSHLKYHVNSHGNNPSFSCNVCDKVFLQKLVLQRHMHIHKPDAFACQQCPRLFRTQKTLATHKVIHSGDSDNLPYKCDTCSNRYLTKANLKQHRLKHDQNSTRYSCPVCKKSFLRQSTLRLHQKRHTKRARHSCPQCYKTFNDVDALTRHIKQHSATERYRCTQCDVSVNRRDNMLRHLRSMHPGVQFESGVQIIGAKSIIQVNAAPTEPVQTVRYNSVIQSVGNVEPVKVAISQPEVELEKETVVAPSLPDKMQNENVKLYRKIILDLDNEEYSNELTNGMDMDLAVATTDVQQVTMPQCHTEPQLQRVPVHGSSNFSERHWRKNFILANSYDNEHIN
ncbi:zinc finger protein 271 [Drosophila innubila]|uniref:zinc finger protein 271 n=1 Tax=Drosophila innubila TaxID=198719 RepID=UPI00148B8AEB|nr:zinc finger protein 271 [Drosophila innubila]